MTYPSWRQSPNRAPPAVCRNYAVAPNAAGWPSLWCSGRIAHPMKIVAAAMCRPMPASWRR